ncbi:MAG: hypothetical protein ACOYMN_18135 [Roseimicrobium sp.]
MLADTGKMPALPWELRNPGSSLLRLRLAGRALRGAYANLEAPGLERVLIAPVHPQQHVAHLQCAEEQGAFCLRVLPTAQSPSGQSRRHRATAHKLARIIYGMIASGKAYEESEAFKVTLTSLAHRLKNLQKQAQALGLQLVPAA